MKFPPLSQEEGKGSVGDTKLRKRRKRHLAWEQADLAAHGAYTQYLHEIADRYPQLTPMELRVAALVRAMLPSWKIGQMLGIEEVTVENHRVNIRHKLHL